MVFNGDSKVKLVKIRDFITKNDRTIYFVTLADVQTYENCDFVLDTDVCIPSDLKLMSDYMTKLIFEGKYSKVQLYLAK